MVTPNILAKLQNELNPIERISDLFSGKDDRQDLTNELLYAIAQLLAENLPDLSQLVGAGNSGGSGGLIERLGIVRIDQIKNRAALTTDTIIPDLELADVRDAHRVVAFCNNGFDQAVRMDVIGNDSSSVSGSFIIAQENIAANSRGSYGLKLEEWQPYIGVQIVPAVSPTAGKLEAFAIKQV